MNLALAVITRDTKEDSKLLDRLLDNISPYVQGIFITTEKKQGYVEKIAQKHKATVSEFKWINDFSAARNFNFSQVPKEYDYIMWSDIDDMWRGLEKLRIGDKDAYSFWYLYDFDEDKQPIVSHKKTMIVRNDGSFSWKGKIHEDLLPNRDITIDFIEDIHRMHLTNETRQKEASVRNLEIAKETYKNDKDPRNLFNLGNSHLGVGEYKEAKEVFLKFLEESGSNDEKYLVRQRLANIEFYLGNREKALEHLYICIGLEPMWPDAYLQLGQLLHDMNDLEGSEKYLLGGLVLKPQYRSMIVFNPRDYDYNPMNLLAKVYFLKSRPDLALPLLKGCLSINPNNEGMKELVAEMEKQNDKLVEITKVIEYLKGVSDDELEKRISELPVEQQSHPGVCQLKNSKIFKKESSGKDIYYYCGYTEHEWNPELFKTKGFGGSEEAVVHLSKRWAAAGYNVTVFANIGHKDIKADGVTWKPFWSFNPKDVVDLLVLWRSPKLCDYELSAKKVIIDLHDVIQSGEFTEKRLKRIDKVFVKTQFHKSLFNLPEDKVDVIPNGLDLDAFAGESIKDEMMILNTSSPDRSMEAVVKIYEKVKSRMPNAKMYWAYGWDVFNKTFAQDKKMLEWRDSLIKEMDRVGIIQLGKLPQKDIVDWYKRANILLYPTEFAEIDCISVKKAQLAGCNVITTDFGALNESVKEGIKIHSRKTKDNWCLPYQISFAVEDELLINEFVEQTVKALQKPRNVVPDMSEYSWNIISDKWLSIWK